MIKRIDQRDRCVDALAAHILTAGLAGTSLRQLAEAAGVSNRMLLYYFEDKADILVAVLMKVSADLAAHLAEAIPEDARLAPADCLKKSAAAMLAGDVRPYMQLSIEIVAAAGRGTEPYASLAPSLFDGFLVWVEAHLSTENATKRKAEAAMILAMIDGLTVLSFGGKPKEADAALERMIEVLKLKCS